MLLQEAGNRGDVVSYGREMGGGGSWGGLLATAKRIDARHAPSAWLHLVAPRDKASSPALLASNPSSPHLSTWRKEGGSRLPPLPLERPRETDSSRSARARPFFFRPPASLKARRGGRRKLRLPGRPRVAQGIPNYAVRGKGKPPSPRRG
jgi:hypothetical protein